MNQFIAIRGCSSVVERSLCMWKARGSIPRISTYFLHFFCLASNQKLENGCFLPGSNLRGQSPLDFKSNALTTRPQLQCYQIVTKSMWRCGGSNPGPFTCKANALPLSYIPSVMNYIKSTTKQTRLVFLWWRFVPSIYCLRPYHVENTSSRLITEVKQHWALWVLGWVTAWEHRVLKTLLLIFFFF